MLEKWSPIKFEAEVELIYAKYLLARFIPLSRLAFVFGIVAFIGYVFWDLMLDPLALSTTGPIRLVAVFHFVVCFALTFIPAIRNNPTGPSPPPHPGAWPAPHLVPGTRVFFASFFF